MIAMIATNLTTFVTECENDNALSQFVEKVIGARFAHATTDIEGNKLVLVVYNEESKLYTPKQLIEEILQDESRIPIIRETVHPIKDHMDYKQRVNRFNE